MNADELYAVLMSVHDDTLLLPNAAVAEVLARDALQASDGGPEWLAGHCDWNSRRVPVVPGRRCRESAPRGRRRGSSHR